MKSVSIWIKSLLSDKILKLLFNFFCSKEILVLIISLEFLLAISTILLLLVLFIVIVLSLELSKL